MTIMVKTDAWLDELRTRLPGISEGQLTLELKSTLREFFTKSGFWTEELEPINIIADRHTYKLTYPQAQIMGVQNVWIEGHPIGLTAVQPKRISPGSNRASVAYMLEPSLMRLFPTPNIGQSEDGMLVIARLNPLPEMCSVPQEATTHFFDEIMDGVLGRLYSMPGKPYTNLVQSQYHLRRFRDGIALARDMARRRYSNATRPWSFPQGWAGNNFRRGNGRTA